MAIKDRPKVLIDSDYRLIQDNTVFWKSRFSKEGGSNIIYSAYARPGTALTSASWMISKKTYDASGDVIGNNFVDGLADFQNVYDNGDQVTMTGATQANPVVVTVDATAYSGGDGDNIADGDVIEIDGVVGMTELNDNFYIVANWDSGAKTFELTDIDGNNVDGTGYTAYSSGGEAHKRTYANYTYS